MIQFDYIRTESEYKEAIAALSTQDNLACDSETYALPELKSKGSALDPHTGRISLFIAKGRDTIPYVFDFLWMNSWGCDYIAFKELLLSRDYLVLHNSKFDLKFLLGTLGFMPENVHDTLAMAKLFTNATGSKTARLHGHSYADLCRDYLDIHLTGKKDLRESSWYSGLQSRHRDNPDWLAKLTYAANDVQYLFQLHDILYKSLTDPLPDSPLTQTGNTSGEWGFGMQEVLEREFKYTPLLAEREYIGLPVSKKAMQLIQQAVDKKLNEVACRLSIAFNLDEPKPDWKMELVPTETALKRLRSSTGLLDLIKNVTKLGKLDNVQSNVLSRLCEILDSLAAMEHDSEAASEVFIDEDEEALYSELEFIEQSTLLKLCPLMQDVLEFKRLSKQAGMNLTKFINPVTGRIHANFGQIETATGRIACIAAGQKVLTTGGSIRIEDIKEGTSVFCYTEDGDLVTSPVIKTFDNEYKDVVKVYWKSYHPHKRTCGYLTCTPEHRLKVDNGEWVEAADTMGLTLFDSNKKVYRIQSVGKARVYNLTVRTYHNYIVEDVCVANCSSPNLQQVTNRLKVPVECNPEEFFKANPAPKVERNNERV